MENHHNQWVNHLRIVDRPARLVYVDIIILEALWPSNSTGCDQLANNPQPHKQVRVLWEATGGFIPGSPTTNSATQFLGLESEFLTHTNYLDPFLMKRMTGVLLSRIEDWNGRHLSVTYSSISYNPLEQIKWSAWFSAISFPADPRDKAYPMHQDHARKGVCKQFSISMLYKYTSSIYNAYKICISMHISIPVCCTVCWKKRRTASHEMLIDVCLWKDRLKWQPGRIRSYSLLEHPWPTRTTSPCQFQVGSLEMKRQRCCLLCFSVDASVRDRLE